MGRCRHVNATAMVAGPRCALGSVGYEPTVGLLHYPAMDKGLVCPGTRGDQPAVIRLCQAVLHTSLYSEAAIRAREANGVVIHATRRSLRQSVESVFDLPMLQSAHWTDPVARRSVHS